MITVKTIGDIVERGYCNIRLVGAKDYEVLKYRKMYPQLNIWNVPADMMEDISGDLLTLGISPDDETKTATVFTARLKNGSRWFLYKESFMCLELIGE